MWRGRPVPSLNLELQPPSAPPLHLSTVRNSDGVRVEKWGMGTLSFLFTFFGDFQMYYQFIQTIKIAGEYQLFSWDLCIFTTDKREENRYYR
jgi:hypothetical protein